MSEGAFGTQYGDTYPGILQKILVVNFRGIKYYLGFPDDFDGEKVTAFLDKYPGAQVTVDWMIVPIDEEGQGGEFDTTLTDYPENIVLGDSEYPIAGKFETRGWGVRSTADLDARDHYAYDGIKVTADPSVPDDEIHMVGADGIVHRIVNFSTDPDDHPLPTNPEAAAAIWDDAGECQRRVDAAKAEVFAVTNQMAAAQSERIKGVLDLQIKQGRYSGEWDHELVRRIKKLEKRIKKLESRGV